MLTREAILGGLRASIASGQPIIAAGASAGIVAKHADRGGADLIVAYSTGRSRIMGLPTTQIDNDNVATLAMYTELRRVVDRAALIGGVNATDPYWKSPRELVERFREVGYDGLINFPTVSVHRGPLPYDGYSVRGRSAGVGAPGYGIERELDMVRYARETNILTMVYVFEPEQAAAFADAGVDIVVPHVDWTAGGLVGSGSTAISMEEACLLTQEMIAATWAVSRDIICLSHGGPISSPDDTAELYRDTDAQGFVGASSIERIPFEEAVVNAVRAFRVPIADDRLLEGSQAHAYLQP